MHFASFCLQKHINSVSLTQTLKVFCKKKKRVRERKGERNSRSLVVSWCLPLYETLVVCSQNDLPCLLTNIPDPLLCDCLCTQLVVLWLFMRPKEVFHTTNITNLTVPLSRACCNWSLKITWFQWCQPNTDTHNILSYTLPTPPALP